MNTNDDKFETKVKRLWDILDVLKFMYWLRKDQPNAIWGGVKIDVAYKNILNVYNLSEEQVTFIMEGKINVND